MVINLILGQGDGYSPETQLNFANFLSRNGFNVISIPLLESNPQISYEDLKPDNYCKFIDKYVNKNLDYIMVSISKSCHWFKIYASKRSNIKKLIMIEPTTLNPKLLVEYEKSRNNYFVEEYFKDDNEYEYLDSDQKALDSIVSDKKNYFPKCPIVIIWTNRNNQNEFYSEKVIMLKKEYEKYLKRNGCKLKSFTINSEHNATTHEKNFDLLLKLINE